MKKQIIFLLSLSILAVLPAEAGKKQNRVLFEKKVKEHLEKRQEQRRKNIAWFQEQLAKPEKKGVRQALELSQ